jgi:hypothetical protein
MFRHQKSLAHLRNKVDRAMEASEDCQAAEQSLKADSIWAAGDSGLKFPGQEGEPPPSKRENHG